MNLELATFGAGCFWCVEAIFSRLNGVQKVLPGYSGGRTENPTYEEVCTGTTDHVEVCRIEFDSDILSFEKLLEVFWKTHDPTTKDRQGADIGTQYRSVIFYHDAVQKQVSEAILKKLDEADIWSNPIVTSIEPLTAFYEAENYHRDYFKNNPSQQYCSVVINPKVDKFEKAFSDILK